MPEESSTYEQPGALQAHGQVAAGEVRQVGRKERDPGDESDARQIEAARRAMVRFIKRGGKIWVRVFPDHPVTKKAAETRMGSGKGAVDHWVAVVKPGRMIFEIAGVSEDTARDAMRLAAFKLPIKTQFVVREELLAGSEQVNA